MLINKKFLRTWLENLKGESARSFKHKVTKGKYEIGRRKYGDVEPNQNG